MGKMASTGKQTQKYNQTSTAAPPSWSLQNHQTAAKDALKNYQQGVGQQVYQGNRVAGLDNLTQQGIDNVGKNAANYQQYMENVNKNYAGQPSYQEQNLGGIAAQNPGILSPAFQQYMQNQLGYARDKVGAQSSALGMQGGSSAATAAARALGQTAGDIYAGQYNRQIEQKIAAANAMEQGAGQRNALLANANSQSNAMNDALIRAGQIRQAQEQAQIGADMAKFQETQDAPWRGLALLNQITNGADNGYGTTTGSGKSTMSGQASLMDMLRGGAGMALAGFGGASGLSGLGSLAGFGLGALSGDGRSSSNALRGFGF